MSGWDGILLLPGRYLPSSNGIGLQTHVTDSVDDKSLFGSISSTSPFKVVSNEQIGAQAYTFSTNEHQ